MQEARKSEFPRKTAAKRGEKFLCLQPGGVRFVLSAGKGKLAGKGKNLFAASHCSTGSRLLGVAGLGAEAHPLLGKHGSRCASFAEAFE